MRIELNVCQECPVKCPQGEKASDLIEAVLIQGLDKDQIRGRVSTFSQEARREGCPTIPKLRIELLAQIDPELAISEEGKQNFVMQLTPTPVDIHVLYLRDQLLENRTPQRD